jgi:outer membrane lipopolysaccharide assembly protein LptE/RlpB
MRPMPAPTRAQRAALAILLATLLAPAAGCGYHLAGHGNTLPPEVKSIGIPIFVNRTSRPELEQRVTEAVIDEFSTRGRVRIVAGEEGADAVLRGTLYSYTTMPVVLNEQGRARRYEILITADVALTQAATDRVLWENDHFLFKQQYEVPETSIAYVDREIVAIDEVADDFASTIVTSILEGF